MLQQDAARFAVISARVRKMNLKNKQKKTPKKDGDTVMQAAVRPRERKQDNYAVEQNK